MKINCGPAWQEKYDASKQWHPWFAWRSVRVSPRDCRWLETIERRYVPAKYPVLTYLGGTLGNWEYRA